MRRLAVACACAVLALSCTSSTRAGAPAPAQTSKAASAGPQRPAAGRLPGIARPTGYTLDLRVDPRQERFSGTTEIALEVSTATPELHFHAENMNLRRVSVEWNGEQLPASVQRATGPGLEDAHEQVATLPRPVGPGAVRLVVEYDAPFDTHLSGLYRANDGDDWYASTQLEPIDARKMFPSLDEPGWKVPFEITLTVPEGLGAFSNAPEASRSSKEGQTTVRFQPTKPIATYLVAIAVGPFDVVEGPTVRGVPIRGIAPRGRGPMLHEALKLHAELLPILEEYFGHPYPYEKLDAVAVLEFAAGAMENPGLIIYREEALLLDPRTASADDREGVARTVAHELAHQWFGNLVTLTWWDDLWLNEAFAEWTANHVLDGIGIGRAEAMLEIREWMLRSDAAATAQPVRRPGSGVALGPQFNVATFKGSMVLVMLEKWLGEEAFRAGVREYIRSRAWGHAVSEDLFVALERHAGDKPVRAVAGSFLDLAGAPQIAAVLHCDDGAREVQLSQTRYHALGTAAPAAADPVWQVPVCIDFPDGGAIATRCTVMKDRTTTLRLEGAGACPAWVHPNSGEHGYYRWAMAPEALQLLTGELLGGAAPSKALQQARAALLDQTWAMVEGGALPASAFLAVLEKAAASPDADVALQLAGSFRRVGRTWQSLAVTPQFRGWVERLLGERTKALGWTPRKGETDAERRVRAQLLALLGGLARTPWVVDGAASQARKYLKDPASVPPELSGVALTVAARNGRVSFAELQAFLQRAKDPTARLTALVALGSLPPGPELEAALKLLLTDQVRLQDAATLYQPAMNGRESREATMTFIQQHWAALEQRMAGFSGAGVGQLQRIVGEYCEEAPRERARAFFAQKKLRGEALTRNVDESSRCIAISKVGCEGVARRLDPGGGLAAMCRAAPPGDYPVPDESVRPEPK